MKITVLGCGPAGLLATHAAALRGHDVRVVSRKRPSVISGAQYLHQFIPGVTYDAEETGVYYVKMGQPEVYAKKVYGDATKEVSWYHFESGKHSAWPMQLAYKRLFREYYDHIEDHTVDPMVINALLAQSDLVVSTLPRYATCCARENDLHTFDRQTIYIADGVLPVPNIVVYSGRMGDEWYRASNLFGHSSYEFAQPPHSSWGSVIRTGFKPLAHNCNCWVVEEDQGRFMYAGRFGQWQRGVLVHHAYNEMVRRLDNVV